MKLKIIEKTKGDGSKTFTARWYLWNVIPLWQFSMSYIMDHPPPYDTLEQLLEAIADCQEAAKKDAARLAANKQLKKITDIKVYDYQDGSLSLTEPQPQGGLSLESSE